MASLIKSELYYNLSTFFLGRVPLVGNHWHNVTVYILTKYNVNFLPIGSRMNHDARKEWREKKKLARALDPNNNVCIVI